jgi:hypothetical protein
MAITTLRQFSTRERNHSNGNTSNFAELGRGLESVVGTVLFRRTSGSGSSLIHPYKNFALQFGEQTFKEMLSVDIEYLS